MLQRSVAQALRKNRPRKTGATVLHNKWTFKRRALFQGEPKIIFALLDSLLLNNANASDIYYTNK